MCGNQVLIPDDVVDVAVYKWLSGGLIIMRFRGGWRWVKFCLLTQITATQLAGKVSLAPFAEDDSISKFSEWMVRWHISRANQLDISRMECRRTSDDYARLLKNEDPSLNVLSYDEDLAFRQNSIFVWETIKGHSFWNRDASTTGTPLVR
jgi:hypothetical protein